MSRAVLPWSLRPSDVMRVYPKVNKPGFGSRVVVVQKEVHSDSVKISYRGLTGGTSDRRVSDSKEGVVFLNRKILHPVEGVWEGELIPGSRGRIVMYNNRRYESPAEGEDTKVPAKTKRGGTTAAKGRTAASKAKSNGGTTERATEAQLDKLSAQVVKMRDGQGKAWGDICDALDIQPSRARQLYNRGGGEPNTPDRSKPAAKKGAGRTAASRRKGKNPS